MPPPILITGAARSGTSMTAGTIHLCGAFGGDMSGPTPNNRKGMFENHAIRNTIIKPFLRYMGCDPLGQNPLPEPLHMPKLTGLREKVLEIIQGQGYDGGPWFYKGAKMCLIWPAWHQAFPEARWIVVRRRDEDIINSCLKTGFMRAFKGQAGWQWWVRKHLQRFEEMKEAGLDVREVWPTRMVEGDFSEIRGVVGELGLDWDEEAVMDFISPALWSGSVSLPRS